MAVPSKRLLLDVLTYVTAYVSAFKPVPTLREGDD
jgi:hypothetical protein